MKRSDRRLVRATDWLASAAVVVGGYLLLHRVRAAPAAASQTVESDATGRGRAAAPPSPAARRAGHETRDLNARTLTFLVLGLGTTVAVVVGCMVLLGGMLHRVDVADQGPLTAEQTARVVPPAPTLQAAPLTEIARLDAAAEQRLDSYGWTDAAHSRAHIPIARASALMVGRTLAAPP